ncbi:MAG: nitroreductase family protein [Lachnospiraceae bacterium]|nr:nitroreductase family protein [Lachnospiraceae bacterium]
MNFTEAMSARHTVRKYKDTPLSKEVVEQLQARIDANNEKLGTAISLVTDTEEGIPGIVKLLMTKNVKNYFVLAGPETPDMEEKLGYASADLMLYAQTIGLNTWWIGGTFSRNGVRKAAGAADENKVIGIVVVGYGENQGRPHKSKKAEEISSYEGEAPDWFKAGVEAVLLAPTAVNRQAYTIAGKGSQVTMTCKKGAFSDADLGIGKYHFEIGAGKDAFDWKK